MRKFFRKFGAVLGLVASTAATVATALGMIDPKRAILIAAGGTALAAVGEAIVKGAETLPE